MELRALGYFLAVSELGSLRAAAKRVGVTQPALTKAIHRLEDEAGVKLIERSARGVRLTGFGEVMLRHSRTFTAALREAQEEIAALRDGSAGQVRIGAGPSWERAILPEAIARFCRARPSVRLQVTGGTDDALKTQLRQGSLDFVLAATADSPGLDPDLDWRSLITDEYRVIAASSHPLRGRAGLRLADLASFPWVLPSRQSHMVERLHVMFRTAGLKPPDPAIETDIVPLKLQLMRDGAYLSFHAAGHLSELNAGFVQPLDVAGASWRRAAGIILRRGAAPGVAAQALIAEIEACCAAARATASHPPGALLYRET